MTVAAPSLDTAGAALLTTIAQMQVLVNAGTNGPVRESYRQTLGQLQMQAVDHFMATYWVSADSILATMPPSAPGRAGTFITGALTGIATRAAQVAVILARGLPVSTMGNDVPQYSTAWPLVQTPDTYWYALQQYLIDWCMAQGVMSAAQILSTMTGAQTYPFNYGPSPPVSYDIE